MTTAAGVCFSKVLAHEDCVERLYGVRAEMQALAALLSLGLASDLEGVACRLRKLMEETIELGRTGEALHRFVCGVDERIALRMCLPEQPEITCV
jgi:hypothetical protein